MKKFLSTIFTVSTCFSAFAQEPLKTLPLDATQPIIKIEKEPRFMLNIHSAYSMGLGSTFKFYPDDVSSISVIQNGNALPQKTTVYANPTKGLGDGFKFGFGGAYIVNDFINLGLDFDYFSSTIKKYRDSSFYQTNPDAPVGGMNEYQYTERNIISYQATLLSLTPSITFKAIARPNWFLYNKIGAIVTFRPNSLQEDITNKNERMGWQGFTRDSSSNTIKKYEWGIRNPAFGFMGAFGGQVKITKQVRFFSELQFSHIVFVIRKRTLTDFVVDKIHLENTFPKSMRELEFVKSYSTDINANNPDRPSQTIIQRIPISYLGLQVGLVYQLK